MLASIGTQSDEQFISLLLNCPFREEHIHFIIPNFKERVAVFSENKSNGLLCSPFFQLQCGVLWRIKIQFNNKFIGGEKTVFPGFYIECSARNAVNARSWLVCSNLFMEMIPWAGMTSTIRRQLTHNFTDKEPSIGYSRFISFADAINPLNDILSRGEVHFHVYLDSNQPINLSPVIYKREAIESTKSKVPQEITSNATSYDIADFFLPCLLEDSNSPCSIDDLFTFFNDE